MNRIFMFACYLCATICLAPRAGISQKKQKNIYDYSLEELLIVENC